MANTLATLGVGGTPVPLSISGPTARLEERLSNHTGNISLQTTSNTQSASQGARLIFIIGLGQAVSITGITDSKGNTWTVDSSPSDGTRQIAVAHCDPAHALATTDTITVALSSQTTTVQLIQIWLEEFVVSGGSWNAAPDQIATAGVPGGSNPTVTVATGTLAKPVEVAIWAARWSNVLAINQLSGLGSWSLLTWVAGSGVSDDARAAYAITAATTALSGSLSSSSAFGTPTPCGEATIVTYGAS